VTQAGRSPAGSFDLLARSPAALTILIQFKRVSRTKVEHAGQLRRP
jgi:hypothetical protein